MLSDEEMWRFEIPEGHESNYFDVHVEDYRAMLAQCREANILRHLVDEMRGLLGHAYRCDIRDPAQCQDCKRVWLKGSH